MTFVEFLDFASSIYKHRRSSHYQPYISAANDSSPITDTRSLRSTLPPVRASSLAATTNCAKVVVGPCAVLYCGRESVFEKASFGCAFLPCPALSRYWKWLYRNCNTHRLPYSHRQCVSTTRVSKGTERCHLRHPKKVCRACNQCSTQQTNKRGSPALLY